MKQDINEKQAIKYLTGLLGAERNQVIDDIKARAMESVIKRGPDGTTSAGFDLLLSRTDELNAFEEGYDLIISSDDILISEVKAIVQAAYLSQLTALADVIPRIKR